MLRTDYHPIKSKTKNISETVIITASKTINNDSNLIGFWIEPLELRLNTLEAPL
jgi:hypothetical protein